MAHNQRFNNDKKYDPKASKALRKLMQLEHWDLTSDDTISMIKREIRRGADPHILMEQLPPGDQSNSAYRTLFEMLAYSGEADFLQELFAMGLEPTPGLIWQALAPDAMNDEASVEIVNIILNENPDLINITDQDGNSILIYSLISGFLEDFIESLLERGVDPNLQNDRGQTALMLAAEEGDKDIVKLLLRYGAETQLENKQGRLAHSYAKSQGMKRRLPNRQGGRRKTRRLKRKKNNKSKTGKSRRRR